VGGVPGRVSAVTGSPARVESSAFVFTPGALEMLSHRDLQELLRRHLSGDWGVSGTSDRKANDYALEHAERLLSAYEMPRGRMWITEANRASSCACCRANTDEGSEHHGG
jgi:hypothetical protein